MNKTAMAALILNLGVAGVYAQNAVTMTFSGTAGSSTINLQQPGTSNSEQNSAGDGTLGQFTFRSIRAIRSSPEPSSTCSGPTKIHFSSASGAGVFLFQDGSLLKVSLLQADDCIDFAAGAANCTMMFKIIGGTGRFKDASGTIALTETVLPVLADASNNPVFFAATGELSGTVSGVAADQQSQTQRR